MEIRDGRIAELRVAGRPAEVAALEPPLLASFYGPDLNERRPVTLDELPEHVVRAILAAEDDGFFIHPGVSPTGTARALWVNLRGGEVQQGGSTITQQLVKNLYLSSERTIERKVKEALIAVMLEVRYGKRAILEAYLNEIYWGRSGPANVIGLGAASRAYFGKDAAELSLAEAATLAAMIRAPGDYSPVKDPGKVVERRNWVLRRMAELGWITPARARRASREPLLPDPQPVEARPLAPYFARFAAEEARERFGIDELAGRGLSPLLDPGLARAAGGREGRRPGSRRPGEGVGAARGARRVLSRPRSSRSIRATARSSPGSAGATTPRASSTASRRRGGRPAAPSSRWSTPRRSARRWPARPRCCATRRSWCGSARPSGGRRTTTAASAAG